MEPVVPPTPFARNIRALRKNRGLSQEGLAAELGVTFATVSRWERGKGQTSLESLAMIAKYFGVTAAHLLTDELEEVAS